MIGKNIKVFDVLDSTNNFVKLNVSNLDNGTVVLAKKQTNGRGLRDNKWESNEGNLYFSILLKNDLKRNDVFKHIVMSSMAIILTLKHYNINSLIKYPNDCLVDNKKIAGVLIESSGLNELDYMIIGIGINVNQTDFFDLSNKAISMKQKNKNKFSVEDVLVSFIDNYNKVLLKEYSEIFKEYLNKSFVLNKTIFYDNVEFKISSIENDGSIIIKNETQKVRVAFSEITLKELYKNE